MFSLLLWRMLTFDNCIDTKPMTPTSTTWSNQNIIDWPVMLCTLQDQKEVLWRTPTTWLHAWPGMVRRPITSIAGGVMWWGTGLLTSLQTSGNAQKLQAKQNKNMRMMTRQCAWAQKSRWYLYVSLCQNSEEFIMPCIESQAEIDTTSELPDAVIFASSLG